MKTLAQRWSEKRAGLYSAGYGPENSDLPALYQRNPTQLVLQGHFPYRTAVDTVKNAPDVSNMDKVQLLNSINQAAFASGGQPSGAVQMGSFLPAAAVGAGLGYLGAAYLAPIFGLNDQQKKYFGIGSAALGAVLNTFTGKR